MDLNESGKEELSCCLLCKIVAHFSGHVSREIFPLL
jgi:hypothetical protein